MPKTWAHVIAGAPPALPPKINHTAARRERSNAEYLARSLAVEQRQPGCHPFIASCRRAGIIPGLREVARWRRGEGAALEAAWERWPRGKFLPRRQPAGESN
jgi:hypothetical protein